MFVPTLPTVEAAIMRGGARSGKTAALLERARELAGAAHGSESSATVGQGSTPRVNATDAASDAADGFAHERGVLFVCASTVTAERVVRELKWKATVIDAQSLALQCLKAADADRTRVLQPYEGQFLFEDLRTCGLPQKQIRKVLAFIYATMAACGDNEPGWIEMHEERLVYDALMEALAFTGGTVEPELASRAVRLLGDDPDLRERCAFDHVLVDDYGLLSRASQLLCNLLARKSIAVAGEPGFALAAGDSHPNPAGLEEFVALHPDARVLECAPDVNSDSPANVAPAASAAPGLDAGLAPATHERCVTTGMFTSGSVSNNVDTRKPAHSPAVSSDGLWAHSGAAEAKSKSHAASDSPANLAPASSTKAGHSASSSTGTQEERVTAGTLKDEFGLIVQRVQDALAAGTPADRIAVMGANRTWLQNIAHVLGQQGVPVRLVRRPIRIRDFRDPKGCAAAYYDTIDRLARDPEDGVALRSLYGFGDYLARSAEVKRFRKEHPGASITELVPLPDEELLEQARNEQAKAAAERAHESRGEAPSPAGVGNIHGASTTGSPERSASAGSDSSETPSVWIGAPQESFGRTFDLVVFGGLVPGWLPAAGYAEAVGSNREHMRDDAALSISCARRAAPNELMLTGFEECSLEFAERYRLDYDRSRMCQGVRTCTLRPAFTAYPELFEHQ